VCVLVRAQIANDITQMTPASFEPSIDYVVTKVPRFNFEKFAGSKPELTTMMKSVGEVGRKGGSRGKRGRGQSARIAAACGTQQWCQPAKLHMAVFALCCPLFPA